MRGQALKPLDSEAYRAACAQRSGYLNEMVERYASSIARLARTLGSRDPGRDLKEARKLE